MFSITGTPKPGDITKVAANPDDVLPDASRVLSGQKVQAMANNTEEEVKGGETPKD